MLVEKRRGSRVNGAAQVKSKNNMKGRVEEASETTTTDDKKAIFKPVAEGNGQKVAEEVPNKESFCKMTKDEVNRPM